MALATPDLHETLIAVRRSARAAEHVAERLPERVGWVVLLVVLGVAIIVASRLPAGDPVLRRLAQAPADNEGNDPEEDTEVARARAEVSVPWDEAKSRLHEAD